MRKALRKSLENKWGTPIIIFLNDEQRKFEPSNYSCFFSNYFILLNDMSTNEKHPALDKVFFMYAFVAISRILFLPKQVIDIYLG